MAGTTTPGPRLARALRAAALVAALLAALVTAAPARAARTLQFGYIGGPLSYISLSVLQAAYAKLGIEARGVRLPAARALAQSAAGATDGEVHRIDAIKERYPQLLQIPIPVNTLEGLAITCGRDVDTTTPEAISGYRIGVKIGNRYAERLVQGMPSVTLLVDERKLVDMLVAHRLDIVVGDRPWANTLLTEPGNACLRINEPPLVTVPLYHYLHERHRDLVPAVTAALRELRDSGEMRRIVQRVTEDLRKGLVEWRQAPPGGEYDPDEAGASAR